MLPKYLRLLFKPPTLDLETAVWEIAYLLTKPRKVYKSLYYRHQTKNQWSRDDPAFVVLLSFLLVLSAFAWGLAYSSGVLSVLQLMLYMVVVDFLAVGVIVATVAWFFASRFLLKESRVGELEWAYCFDVHCNSFLALWVWLYVVQYIALPILDRRNWLSLFLGNTLYLTATIHYSLISFLGYSTLPFLKHTQLLLAPAAVAVLVYILTLVTGFSVVRFMLAQYFVLKS